MRHETVLVPARSTHDYVGALRWNARVRPDLVSMRTCCTEIPFRKIFDLTIPGTNVTTEPQIIAARADTVFRNLAFDVSRLASWLSVNIGKGTS